MGGVRVAAGNRGRVQVIRDGGRKRFDAARREVFLDWLGATCNLTLSAEKAGVAPVTVIRHRRRDPGFAEEWRVALQQGRERLEAELLQAPWRTAATAGDGGSFDVATGIRVLAAVARAEAGGKGGQAGPKPRVANEDEMRAELVRRLRVLRARLAGE